jgi:hypothetical protein
MFIYKNWVEQDFLIKVGANNYKMKISGWPSGGFTAPSDSEALEIFQNIIEGDK